MRLLAVVKNPASIARYLAAAGELTDGAQPGLGPCRAARLDAARPTGRAACSAFRRWVAAATAETTAEATMQRKRRKRGRGLHRTRAKPASPEGLASPKEASRRRMPHRRNTRARPRAAVAGPSPAAMRQRSREWAGKLPLFHLRSPPAH